MTNRNKACQLLQTQYKQFQSYKHQAIQDIFLLEIELSILNLELDKFTFIENKYKNTKIKWYQHRVMLRKLACFGPSYCRSYVAKLRHSLEEDILLTMKEAEREGKEWRYLSRIKYGKPLMEIVEDVSKHRTLFKRSWSSLGEDIKFANLSNSIHNTQIKLKDKIKADIAKMRKMCLMENKIKPLSSASAAVENFISTNSLLFNVYKKHCQNPTIDLALRNDFVQNKNMVSKIFATNSETIKFCKLPTLVKNKNTKCTERKQNAAVKVYRGNKKLTSLKLQKADKYSLRYKKFPVVDGKTDTQSSVSYSMFTKGCYLENKVHENSSEEISSTTLFDNNMRNSVSMEIDSIVEKYKTNGTENSANLASDLEFTEFFQTSVKLVNYLHEACLNFILTN